MKLLSALLVLVACGDSYGFQVAHPSFHTASPRGVKAAHLIRTHEPSSLVVCQMLLNNDALNSNSNSSSQQHHSQHYFHNQKANGEVAKPSHDERSFGYQQHQPQHCTGLRMAHGAICPETIAAFEKDSNPAIQRFVETYHKRGPLACEDLLSDPEVLPHLTKAMRDIYL